jgi:hypothetical protein
MLPGTLTLTTGRYQWLRASASVDSAASRPLVIGLRVECCDYYNGRSADTSINLGYHPSASFGLEFNHQLQNITLPSGHMTIHIESLNTSFNFTAQMQLKSEFQYDNVSHGLSASLRFKWQIHPATELFVALGESALLFGDPVRGSYHSQGTAIVVRFGHRLQY